MLNIIRYAHDSITDSIEIKVLFQTKINGEVIQDGGTFSTKLSGDIWLSKLKKDYLTIRLENFYHHKKHIIETSPGHKSLQAKNEALNKIFRYLLWACKIDSLTEVCKWLIDLEPDLNKIVPGSSNPSYQSSCDELKLLLDFARKHTGNNQLKKAS